MTSENIAVDNEKRNLVGEINDQDVQDVTQNSLTKKTKSLRKTHMSTQVFIANQEKSEFRLCFSNEILVFQVNILQNESTLLDYRNNASTPNTLKRTRLGILPEI